LQPGKVAPSIHFGTTSFYFATIEKQIASQSQEWNYVKLAQSYRAPEPQSDAIAAPTWKDQLYLETHRGVYTTQGNPHIGAV
jgi:alpha-mannosidase